MNKRALAVVSTLAASLVLAAGFGFASEPRRLPMPWELDCREPVSPWLCVVRALREFLGVQPIKIGKDNPLDYRYLTLLSMLGFSRCGFWELYELVYLGNCVSLMQLAIIPYFQAPTYLVKLLLVFEFEDEPYVFSHPHFAAVLGSPFEGWCLED